MSGPHDDHTVEQPAVEQPSVRTAPPPSRIQRWWASVPPHIGPARTSTVVLAVLFLALGSLYLTVRPEPAPVVAVQTTTPAANTARSTTPRTSAPTTTSEAPTPTTGTTTAPTSEPTTQAPSETTTTESSTETTVPTTETPTTEAPTTAPTTTESSAPTS